MTAEVSSQEGSLSDPLPRVLSPEVDFVGGTNPRLFGKIIRTLLQLITMACTNDTMTRLMIIYNF